MNDSSHLLFSAEQPGEEDAEDLRSIRSSKIRWHSANGVPIINGVSHAQEDVLERFEE